MNNIRYEDILQQLSRTRQMNIRTQDNRKAEVYERLPRVREIDSLVVHSRLQAARMRIQGQQTDAPDVDIESLLREKRELMKSAGYPYDYMEPVYSCRLCRDTGYVDGSQCTCLKKMIVEQLYEQSTIKKVLEVENFDTFRLDYYPDKKVDGHNYTPYQTMKSILANAKKFTADFENNRPGILLHGETGRGKTFLTNCIAKELLDKGYSVLYLSAVELFDNILQDVIIKSSQETHKRMLYDYIYNCDFLIIDDLGTEFTNSFVMSQLFEIINKRTIKGQSTLISTNLSLAELEKRYTARITSRIVDSFLIFNLYGDDIRYAKRLRRATGSTIK